MKLVATLIAGLFAVSAFAQAPAAKKEEKKAEDEQGKEDAALEGLGALFG